MLIAGGIGITPILSMARILRARSELFSLHYVCRTPENMAFRDEVSAFGAERARLYFDNGDPERSIDIASLLARPTGMHVYVCGPKGMIDATIAIARKNNWTPSQVHFELFANAGTNVDDAAFDVELRKSGKLLRVAANQTILDAMIEAGLDPMFECRRGECGSCATKVIEGEPEHRDYCLSDEDKVSEKMMCVCVSRSRTSKLILNA